jgi:mannose-1-phosphate guanylyltransferase
MMIFSVILAGGVGERFWPLSKKKRPKQFLSIIGDDPLLSQTKKRVLELTPLSNIRIVTNNTLKNKILSLGFSKKNLIVEPKGMNTLYAIALAAAKIISLDRNAIMLTLPSDHWIRNNKQFISVIKRGIPWAEKNYLITYGIIPSRVETGYGYIEKGREITDKVLKVKRFTEKPNIKKATSYVKSKNYLWNSGIFLWKAERILEEIKNHQPNLKEPIDKIMKNPSKKNIEFFYSSGSPISIDYGVLERSKNVYVVVSEFDWDDIGTWLSLGRIYNSKESGNIEKGEIYSFNNHNNILFAEDGIIVAKGLDNMIVVHTKNATLIIPKSDAQVLKEIVKNIPPKYQ